MLHAVLYKIEINVRSWVKKNQDKMSEEKANKDKV